MHNAGFFRQIALTVCGVGTLALDTSVVAAEAPLDPQSAPVQAIWKEQEITFFYQSFTTLYSCDGLEDKLAKILAALGARGDAKVTSFGCESGPVRSPRVVVTLFSPVEATREALAEQAKTRGKRDLVARVKADSAGADEMSQQFAAQWRDVSLSRGALGLEPGDCELIEQLQKKLLPKLAVRIVKDEVSCTPYRLTPGQPRLEVQALIEAPKPDQSPQAAPANSQG